MNPTPVDRPPTGPAPRSWRGRELLRALLASAAAAGLVALILAVASTATRAERPQVGAKPAAAPSVTLRPGPHERGMGPWPYAARG